MASFSGKENLMAFKGARLFSGLDPQRPQMNWVCIPCDYNDIQISPDGKYADVGVFMGETSDKYRQACIDRKRNAGDDVSNYQPPTHQMEVNFSKEFRQRALAAAKKRILQEHPEWTGDLADENRNSNLKNAIYDALRIRLGTLYPYQKQERPFYQGVAQQAVGAHQWTPQQPDPTTSQPALGVYDPANDDLPF